MLWVVLVEFMDELFFEFLMLMLDGILKVFSIVEILVMVVGFV